MRRLSMKNKRRKSELSDDSESEKNGGARAAADDNDENDDAAVAAATRKPGAKRSLRPHRGTPVQKRASADGDSDDDGGMRNRRNEGDSESERNGGARKRASQKRAQKRASADANSDDDDEYAREEANGEKSPPKRKRKEEKASTSRSVDDNDQEYEVEELINLRTIKGRRQFLVRWKGYGDSADTWENEKDLSCPKLIEEYLAREKEKDIKLAKAALSKTDKSKKSKGTSKKQSENDENNKDEKEYEVEKIIEVHFKKNGTREFLIRWKGFGPTDDTWEPEKNLNCPELISKFMQKVEKAKVSEMRELRTNRVHTKRYTLSTHDKGRRLSKRNRNKQRATYHECDE